MTTPAATQGEDIDGVPIKRQWFQGVMQRALKTDATLKSISGRRVDEGKGYLSLLASVQMEWQPDGEPVSKLPTRVVIKVLTKEKQAEGEAAFANMQTADGGDKEKAVTFEQITGKMTENGEQPFDFYTWAHNNECLIYDILTKKQTAPTPIAIPRCYYHENEEVGKSTGVIVLEDLSERGKVPDFADNLTLGQARSIFLVLAKMHAWCFKNPDWFDAWKKDAHPFSKSEVEPMVLAIRVGIDAFRRNPLSKDVFKLSDADAERFCDVELLWALFGNDKAEHQPPVLVHGDIWSHNMFFGYDQARRALTDDLVALFDWQTARQGSCYEDMVRFLTSSVDYRLRREHENALIDDYYAELQRLLKGTGVTIPYSVGDVKRWYKDALKRGVAMMLMHAPLVLTTPTASGGYTDEQKMNLVWRVQGGIEDSCWN